jgi:F0F1-type ATP synthase membrane subunit c/vacuolar-type H+-ATPase subunit K
VDSSDRERRIAALIQTMMLASVGLYGAVVAFYRLGVGPEDSPPPPPSVGRLSLFLAALGVAQLAGALLLGRLILRSRRGEPAGRVRVYFILRAAAAECVAIYAFVLGFLGAPQASVLALFLVGAASLALWFPVRTAWDRAMRAAGAEAGPEGVSPG